MLSRPRPVTFLGVLVAGLLSLSGCANRDEPGKYVTIGSSPPGSEVTVVSIDTDRYWIVEQGTDQKGKNRQFYHLREEGLDERLRFLGTTPVTISLMYGTRYIASFEHPGFHTVTVPVDPATTDVRSSGSIMDLPDRLYVTLVPKNELAPANAFDFRVALEKIDEIRRRGSEAEAKHQDRNIRTRHKPPSGGGDPKEINLLLEVFPGYVKEIDSMSPEDRCRTQQRRPTRRRDAPGTDCQNVRIRQK